jgi:hypothetical protein
VRSHAKASSAGSNSSQASRRGSFLRGALATRGASGDANGSSARWQRLVLFCLAVAALMALTASSALAVQTHPYTGVSFGPDGAGGSADFENVGSVAVDRVSGDVYVYDVGAGSIYKFDSAGAPANFTATGSNEISGVGAGGFRAQYQIALAPAGAPAGTAGDIYVAKNEFAIDVYSSTGAKVGEVALASASGGATCGVATDPAGNLYAGIYSRTIQKFTPTANPPTTLDQAGAGTIDKQICNVAVDGLGSVYAARYEAGVFKLGSLGAATPIQVTPEGLTIAVAPGSNDLYVNSGNGVTQYSSAGKEIGSFGNTEFSSSRGIAVNSDASKIYVGTPQQVRVYGSLVTAPTTITGAATGATKISATLHGTIGAAGGAPASCVFQYTSAAQFGSEGFDGAAEKPCSPAGPFTGTAEAAVSAEATGLTSGTIYYFRLVGSNEAVTYNADPASFGTVRYVNVVTQPATALTTSGATLNGTLNPEGTQPEQCFFEYEEVKSYEENGIYGETVPCAESPATIGSGNSPVQVHADLTGLPAATEYHFRLAGTNALGSDTGADATFRTHSPIIEGEALAGVDLTSAIFKAQINPNEEATSYLFEYVSDADFGISGFANATKIPSGGESIGAGTVGVEVEQEATGLVPLTTYRVRAVATNASGVTVGPTLVFTTFTIDTPGLPDGRVFEQATAVDKDGGSAQGFSHSVRTSPAGNGISFFVNGGLPESEGGQDLSPFLALRSDDRWSTQGLLAAAKLGSVSYYKGLSEDLAFSFVTAGFSYSEGVLYKKETASKQYSPLVNIPGYPGNVEFHGTAADNDRVLFAGPYALAPGAAESEASNVYVWDRSGQQVVLAGVFNDGQAPALGTVAGAWDYYFGGGGAGTKFYTQEQHVISADGSKVFFTDAETHQLYMRVNPTQPQSAMSGGACAEAGKACTYQVSKSQRSTADPAGPQGAKFLTATVDGSKVFFMSQEELTDDANTGAADNSNSLYSYDTTTHVLTDLTASTPAENPNGAEVGGVLGISRDGSRLYFAAGGVLAPGASASTGSSCPDLNNELGACNIYQWHAGTTTFVTRLSSRSSLGRGLTWNWAPGGSGTGSPKQSRVSADGRTLIFASANNPTDYDSKGFVEFYRYSDGDSQLLCLTCLPSGEEPRTNTTLQSIEAGILAPSFENAYNTRNLSADGSRFFFESVDRLVRADTNGVKDVYEWEANGTGSCTSSDHNGGCLYLISTGTSPSPSYFGDASESGNDAFIFTAQPLVGQDLDELVDIYDARVGGGLAYQYPPPPSICTGEACLPGATPAPSSQSAGTSSFSGPGNPKPSKQKQKKKKHHKKQSKKKHKSKKHNKQQKQGANRQQGSNR